MSDHPQLELAPLAALGALDGESLRDWSEHAAGCEACRREGAEFEAVAGALGAAAEVQPVSAELRRRVLAAAGVTAPAGPAPRRSARAPWTRAAAASLAAVALGAAALSLRAGRETARREAERLRDHAARLEQQVFAARAELAALEQRVAGQPSFAALMTADETRITALAGLPAAPGAQARVVWNAAQRRAVLMATGLTPAPAGKAYEVWVIAGGAPVPAGLFDPGPGGEAVFAMPWVEDVTAARTFAVTLEPAAGVPAPTGPMVLAGNT